MQSAIGRPVRRREAAGRGAPGGKEGEQGEREVVRKEKQVRAIRLACLCDLIGCFFMRRKRTWRLQLLVNVLTLERVFETCATFRPASTDLDHAGI